VAVIVDMLERYGQGGSGHYGVERPYWSSFLVADPSDAWVVETSGSQWATERVDATRAISNRTTIPTFDAEHRHPRQPVDTLVNPRWEASQAVLAAGDVDVPALRRHLRAHIGNDGWTVCMHVPDVEATTASVIAELPVGGRPWAHMLLGSPCASVFVPLPVGRPLGEPLAWETFAALGPADRTRLDDLEAELAADARDDVDWPAEAWARVRQVVAA
jgi:hypothetical protein